MDNLKKYIKELYKHCDNLLWNNDIDDLDERIDLWLESEEHKKYSIEFKVTKQRE